MKNKECIILNNKELKNFFELFNDNDTFKITIREELNGVELYTRVKLSKKNDIIKIISYINDCFKIDFKNDIIMTYFINDFKRVLKIRLLKSDLTNKKIINEQAKWVIDEKVFLEFCELIKDVTNHQVNEELVAPRNMSERQLGVWEKLYKGRMRKLQKGSRTIGDKILILSISMDSYIPINEIRKMTIFHFNKLYEAISEKESYEAMWDIKMSPKFDSKNSGDSKHWKESFKL